MGNANEGGRVKLSTRLTFKTRHPLQPHPTKVDSSLTNLHDVHLSQTVAPVQQQYQLLPVFLRIWQRRGRRVGRAFGYLIQRTNVYTEKKRKRRKTLAADTSLDPDISTTSSATVPSKCFLQKFSHITLRSSCIDPDITLPEEIVTPVVVSSATQKRGRKKSIASVISQSKRCGTSSTFSHC